MQQFAPLRYDFLTALKNPLPEAFDLGEQCVIRQLAALYGLPYDEVERQMLEIGDITEGVPATMALEFCKRNRFSCYVVWNNTLVAKHEPEKRAHVHACALTIVGGHAVIHKCAKSFAHMKVGEVAPLPEKKTR